MFVILEGTVMFNFTLAKEVVAKLLTYKDFIADEIYPVFSFFNLAANLVIVFWIILSCSLVAGVDTTRLDKGSENKESPVSTILR